jgi:lipopolysaccharide/colanic/teichoic acid biosynthesis glycosyltransferase
MSAVFSHTAEATTGSSVESAVLDLTFEGTSPSVPVAYPDFDGSDAHTAQDYASFEPTTLQWASRVYELEVAEAARRIAEERSAYHLAKRTTDVVFSAIVLLLFSWLFGLIALAIKIEDPRSPVIFTQERVGGNGKTFRMYKFRSMCTDAETQLDTLKEHNEKAEPVFKIRQDPRITHVGKIIRKLSLDELPQFVNILLGSMSIVGPRPALVSEVACYTDYQRLRLLVTPGLTCFWQTRLDRDDISFDEWVSLDLLYIRTCSVWVDLKQIIKTVRVVLTAQGN